MKKIDISNGPSVEPIEIDEAKVFLKEDGSDQDDLITALIVAARHSVEKYLNKSLVSQERTLIIADAEALRSFNLVGPVQSVTSIKVLAEDGTETVLAASDYTVLTSMCQVVLRSGVSPITVSGGEQIVVEYTSGYGTASPVTADDVPKSIKQGMLHIVAHGFEHRETSEEIPPTALLFLNPHRDIPL